MVKKAVIPVAGLGTRFLPITKTIPKELLPIIDRPLIEYTIREAKNANIEEICLVTGKGKDSIIDYFDPFEDLQYHLNKNNKNDLSEILKNSTLGDGELCAVRQLSPSGLGHAVWCARAFIGSDPFAVLLPDDLILGGEGCLQELVHAHKETGKNIVALKEVPESAVRQYGIFEYDQVSNGIYSARDLLEKPEPHHTDSRLAIIGRYIFNAEIITYLGSKERGKGGEIQLTDAMRRMLKVQDFLGVPLTGEHFDCGSKQGYLLAQIAVGMRNPELRDAIKSYFQDR